jgi:hypothetical protein
MIERILDACDSNLLSMHASIAQYWKDKTSKPKSYLAKRLHWASAAAFAASAIDGSLFYLPCLLASTEAATALLHAGKERAAERKRMMGKVSAVEKMLDVGIYSSGIISMTVGTEKGLENICNNHYALAISCASLAAYGTACTLWKTADYLDRVPEPPKRIKKEKKSEVMLPAGIQPLTT